MSTNDEPDDMIVYSIADFWVYNTMLIESSWGESGTGFLVGSGLDDNKSVTFLVTNKHVLARTLEERNSVETVTLHYNVTEAEGRVAAQTAQFPLLLEDIQAKLWYEHPDKDVDVLVINVSEIVARHSADQYPQLASKIVHTSFLANSENTEKEECTDR